ncbi:MerR family transcriptional regulator [Agrilactobacillus yilanensis]|uniref:MerR family transcriptional regulator n=1 Tax=Agrilactobacillus yilanensis TaxID=2485997 RepID=A0ABW4J836_9LACO|nr:MerR family transcriptional regulator [Agrilactobacillus yilanensis]
MAGNHEFKEYKTPSQVAQLIGVSVPTLRKYSLMIEKATTERYFERNQQNTRLYTQENVERLKELTKLSKSPDRTLQDVIAQLYTITESKATTATGNAPTGTAQPVQRPTATNEIAPVEQFMNVLTNMQDTVTQQKQTIDALQQQLKIVQEQNLAILEHLNHTDGATDFEEGIRLPDENKLHITEMSQPESVAENYEALENKHAIVDDDLDAAEKVVRPRTLQDMQLEPEPKKHWWQRLMDRS